MRSTSQPCLRRPLPQRWWFPMACLAASAVLAGSQDLAADEYLLVPVTALEYPDNQLPAGPAYWTSWNWRNRLSLTAYAKLAGNPRYETFVVGQPYRQYQAPNTQKTKPSAYRDMSLVIRVSEAPPIKGQSLQGEIYLPDRSGKRLLRFSFRIARPADHVISAKQYYLAREKYYKALATRQIAGGAWFRKQVQDAQRMQGQNPTRFRFRVSTSAGSGVSDSFDLFSGSRAVSENLQLNAQLNLSAEETNPIVPVDALRGITIREIDWEPLLVGADPTLDVLAAMVPTDQHAVYFPSLASALTTLTQINSLTNPAVQAIEARSEDLLLDEFYLQQLCIPANQLGKLASNSDLVSSAALTGSDMQYALGTEVALLLETKAPSLLAGAVIAAQRKLAQKPGVSTGTTRIQSTSVLYAQNESKTIRSYVAELPNAVVITNSRQQMDRILLTNRGAVDSMDALPEFKFFRNRYQVGSDKESAFVMLTDATIRRWCGPTNRIGHSRRVRAAAVLSALQAEHQDAIISGESVNRSIDNPSNFELGTIRLTNAGVTSSIYGSLDYMTPVSQLRLEMASVAEVREYNNWRRRYEGLWQRAFDPIGIQIHLTDNSISADMTVMPLSANSDYRWWANWAGGTLNSPVQGDQHTNMLFHIMAALDNKQAASSFPFVQGLKSAEFYADDDKFWQELQKQEFMSGNVKIPNMEPPIALRANFHEEKDAKKMHDLLFQLAYTRESDVREERTHRGYKYIARTVPELAGFIGMDRSSMVYVATIGDSLLISLNERLMKEALQRAHARANGKELPPRTKWASNHLAIKISKQGVKNLRVITQNQYLHEMQRISWTNLVILNEWKRRYPLQDPIAVHEQLWGAKLLCAGAGEYRWNEEYQTMESTVFGHPAAPRLPQQPTGPLYDYNELDAGVQFENDGLRGRLELRK